MTWSDLRDVSRRSDLQSGQTAKERLLEELYISESASRPSRDRSIFDGAYGHRSSSPECVRVVVKAVEIYTFSSLFAAEVKASA